MPRSWRRWEEIELLLIVHGLQWVFGCGNLTPAIFQRRGGAFERDRKTY